MDAAAIQKSRGRRAQERYTLRSGGVEGLERRGREAGFPPARLDHLSVCRDALYRLARTPSSALAATDAPTPAFTGLLTRLRDAIHINRRLLCLSRLARERNEKGRSPRRRRSMGSRSMKEGVTGKVAVAPIRSLFANLARTVVRRSCTMLLPAPSIATTEQPFVSVEVNGGKMKRSKLNVPEHVRVDIAEAGEVEARCKFSK
ncbi:hypothetical protein HPB48_008269 [Haemaphysalis longicornis]|uniref:Uncharacterized protein n=1 Tax=Haemaphysalis longicornis TaxID=44386 RepID=A0A9J6GR20_HAELO|nr:hypothetical protein HPB48_008269 [Haemaphysalis longicornis]